MRCGAAVFLVLELFVALPYRPFVLACGVPGLGTEETAAIFADEPCSEYAVSAVPSTEGFSSCHLKLHQFPILRWDDSIVGMLDVVLRNFAVVFLHLVLKEVYRKLLLKEGCTFVLFVCKDTLYNGRPPVCLSPWSRYTFLREGLGKVSAS